MQARKTVSRSANSLKSRGTVPSNGSRRQRAAALAIAFGLIGGAAHASVIPVGDNDRLNVVVFGHIPQRCAVGKPADVDFGDLNARGLQVQAQLPLVCNLPFDLNIKAAHGALANTRLPEGQGPYAGSLGYDLHVDIPVQEPARRIISADFTGEQLHVGGEVNSGFGVAFEGALVRIRLREPSGAGLLAGEYSEVLQLSISPKI